MNFALQRSSLFLFLFFFKKSIMGNVDAIFGPKIIIQPFFLHGWTANKIHVYL